MSDASMSISLEELDAYLVEYKRRNENSNFYVVAATIWISPFRNREKGQHPSHSS